MLNIIGRKTTYLSIAVILTLVSIAAIVAFGFRQGVDFTGGTLWQFSLKGENTSAAEVELFAKTLPGLEDAKLSSDAVTGDYLMRLPTLAESEHQARLSAFKEHFPSFEEQSFQSIGPSVSADLRKNAFTAIVLVLLGISLYIAFAFRKVSRPIASWKYGVVTLLTLFHDVAIPAGMLAILGHVGRVEIDTNFIVALLVVMGFSVHDTIVVFDRIRENLFLSRGSVGFEETVNRSINQTLARSVNTSLTLILVLLALYFTGPAHLTYFILTLLVGVTTGIYSSVFVASPTLMFFIKEKQGKKGI